MFNPFKHPTRHLRNHNDVTPKQRRQLKIYLTVKSILTVCAIAAFFIPGLLISWLLLRLHGIALKLYTSRPPENFKTGLLRGSYQGSGKINILEITSRYIRRTFECIAPEDSSLPFVYYGPAHFNEGEFNIKRPKVKIRIMAFK